MIFVELDDRGFEGEIAACDLKLLHKVGGPGEPNAPTLFRSMANRAPPQDGLPGARRPEAQKISSLFEPGVANREADSRDGVEALFIEAPLYFLRRCFDRR